MNEDTGTPTTVNSPLNPRLLSESSYAAVLSLWYFEPGTYVRTEVSAWLAERFHLKARWARNLMEWVDRTAGLQVDQRLIDGRWRAIIAIEGWRLEQAMPDAEWGHESDSIMPPLMPLESFA